MDGQRLELTTREFTLLVFLARHAGKICTHRMILEHVWGPRLRHRDPVPARVLYRLRRKLGDEGGDLLRTIPGVGYRLTTPEDP